MQPKTTAIITSSFRYDASASTRSIEGEEFSQTTSSQGGQKDCGPGGRQEDGGKGTDPVGVHANIWIDFSHDKTHSVKMVKTKLEAELARISAAIVDAAIAYVHTVEKLHDDISAE